jgi:hypothetical protein
MGATGNEIADERRMRPMKKQKINHPRTAPDRNVNPRTLENTTAIKPNRPNMNTDDAESTIRKTTHSGVDLTAARSQDFYGEKQSGTNRTLRLLELYAGTAPASRFAHRAPDGIEYLRPL